MLGLFTVAQAQGQGSDELARGEFMRWFAEAPWYPTALLPSQGVRWQAVDDTSAQATLAVQVQRRGFDRLVPRRGAE